MTPQTSEPTPTPSQETRRGFIKSSSLLVMGTTVAGGLPLAPPVHGFGSHTIRIGLVGCGTRGRAAVSEILHTEGPIRLVAVADLFDHRLKACLRGLSRQADQVDVPPERQFSGWDAYQQLLQTDCDLVVLATPPAFRPLQLEAVIAAGKHAFIEKPVAVDPAGVRQVLAATQLAKQKQLAIAVGLQRRHEDRYRETITRLQDGIIGDILLSRAYWNGAGAVPHARSAKDTELEHQLRNWHFFTWLSGDHIVEQHVHNLDIINWLKNDYPLSANGMGGREVRTGPEFGQVFDHHCVEFTYADGTKLWSQCRHIPGCWNTVSEHAHGTTGTADISGGRIKNRTGETVWQFGKGGGNGWQSEQDHLIAALRAGRIPNEGTYGAMSTLTAILGRHATYTGTVVTLAELLASDARLAPVERLAHFSDLPFVLPDLHGRYPVPSPGQPDIRLT